MTTETLQNTTKTFKFSFPTCTNEEVMFKLEVPVEIPHGGSTRELVQRVISMFHIPVYLEDELNEKLAEFVAEETKNFHNERDARLLDQLKGGELNGEGAVKHWDKLFKENVVEFAEQKGTSDEEVFAAAYHKLVHSPALETILQVESSYARTVADTLRARDEDIRKLTERQTEEMEATVRQLGAAASEQAVNALAASHFEQQAVAAGRWGSTLDALARAQRAGHRAWLMATLAQLQASDQLHTPTNSPLGTFSVEQALPGEGPQGGGGAEGPRRLEESFTIHLGSQLKQTHNIRIVAMDVLDLCAVRHADNPAEGPRRLQTSLGLYSTELAGCVVLGSAPGRAPGPQLRLLASAAAASTEHHFPDIDAQLRHIADVIELPVEERNERRWREQTAAEGGANGGGGANGAGGANGGGGARAVRRRAAQPGDVFITRHSNLAEVHVVFHLVVDDSLRSGEITSRHPAILGLRNVLKAACANDVTSISLPLLLRHHHSEETTALWCLRRAELVLKCVKGFMLEAAAAGGAELRTLQLLLPPDTQPSVFAALATLPPNIFRLSNPVKGKPPA